MEEQDPSVGPTYRHGEPKPFEFAIGDSENIVAVEAHIEKWIGKPASVFHEVISDKVHIDIHIVPPSESQPCYTVVTSGMSDKPMKAPEQRPDLAYAELFLCLPPDWKMADEDWKQSKYYWPIRALKFMARFPHEYDTWLWYGHTVPNGNPPEPVDASTKLTSFVLLGPLSVPAEFHELRINDEKTIRFFSLVPLYTDELEVKLKRGAEAVEQALIAQGFSEMVLPQRPSIASKRGFFSRFFGR